MAIETLHQIITTAKRVSRNAQGSQYTSEYTNGNYSYKATDKPHERSLIINERLLDDLIKIAEKYKAIKDAL